MTNHEFAAGLRELADFYEQNDDMPQPVMPAVYEYDKADFIKAVKVLSRGGKVTKTVDPPNHSWPKFHAARRFGEITFEVYIDRSYICRLVREAQYECPESLLAEDAAEFAQEATHAETAA